MISLIVAVSKNGIIGKDNKLPWYLPDDLKRFRKLTTGNTVIMGRKTYESIGKPLPNRENIVLTKDTSFKVDGCQIINDINQIVFDNDKNYYIIGGTQIFNLLYDKCNSMEITYIDKDFGGDSYFNFDESKWKITNIELKSCDDFDYRYFSYKRII